jgi:hypothetical protein
MNYLGERLSDATKGLKTDSDEFRRTLSGFGNDAALVAAEIDAIETRQVLDDAERFRIPVPHRPWNEDEQDADFWEWSTIHRTYYLTSEAKWRIRRHIYEERDMATKPLLSVIALALSFLSVIIALWKS